MKPAPMKERQGRIALPRLVDQWISWVTLAQKNFDGQLPTMCFPPLRQQPTNAIAKRLLREPEDGNLGHMEGINKCSYYLSSSGYDGDYFPGETGQIDLAGNRDQRNRGLHFAKPFRFVLVQ